MKSFERRLDEALILLEDAWRPVTPQEIYDHYAMVEGGVPLERFFREITRLYDKLIGITFRLIKDRVFWGAFSDYNMFPTRERFIKFGGNPAFWDKVWALFGDKIGQDTQRHSEGPMPPEEMLSWDINPIDFQAPGMMDKDIDNCLDYLKRSGGSLIISGGDDSAWRSLWELYKKHRNATSLPARNDAIEAILSSYHHSGSLLDYLGTDNEGVPGQDASKACETALDTKAELPLSAWWDKVSPDVQKKVEGLGAISKKRAEPVASLPAGATEEPYFTLKD